MKTISNLFICALLLTLIGIQPGKAQSISLMKRKRYTPKNIYLTGIPSPILLFVKQMSCGKKLYGGC